MAKKNVTITLYMSELVYDVQNKTYLKGRSKTDADPALVAQMQANDDDENINQVLRSIGEAFGTLKNKLSEHIEESGTTGNNVMQANQNITVALKMPSNFNQAAIDVISSGMHRYIVNAATADWFNLTSPNDAKPHVDLANASMSDVLDGINKRVRPTRTEVTP